jgi:hypothetical protein
MNDKFKSKCKFKKNPTFVDRGYTESNVYLSGIIFLVSTKELASKSIE